MTHKRYSHPDSAILDKTGYEGRHLPKGVTIAQSAEELYSRVGARFPVQWEPWAAAEPVIDTNDLPDGVSEADVESALNGMVADGLL